jgi:hypothetical protein
MIKRLLIVLCLMFFLPFYCFAVLTEKEEVHFETNLWVYAPLYYGADTNTYIGFTSSTQIVFRLDGSNTYFNKVWEDTEEDNILTADINANNFSITNAGTFQGSNFITRAGVTLNKPYGFIAGSSSNLSLAYNTREKTIFDTEDDPYDDFLNSTYTVPVDGRYIFSMGCLIGTLAITSPIQISLYTNGVRHEASLYQNYSAYAGANLSGIVAIQMRLLADDTVNMYLYHGDPAGNKTVSGVFLHFSCFYIGD